METTAIEQWLTRVELAARIKVPLQTLAQWASQGRGPRYAKFGRHVRYAIGDVLAWEAAQYTTATTAAAGGDAA